MSPGEVFPLHTGVKEGAEQTADPWALRYPGLLAETFLANLPDILLDVNAEKVHTCCFTDSTPSDLVKIIPSVSF